MNNIFEKLYQLQTIFAEKYEQVEEIEKLPRAINIQEELLERLEKNQKEKMDEQLHLETSVRDLKFKKIEAEDRRKELEAKVDRVENQREYEALEKEMNDNHDLALQLRIDLKKSEGDFNDVASELSEVNELVDSTQQELNESRDTIENEIKKRETRLVSLDKKIAKFSDGVDEEILFKFERIMRSKKGKGLVALSNGFCSGCNMILPMEFINRVRASQEICFCPYCSRVLYYETTTTMDYSLSENEAHDDQSLADFVEEGSEDDEIGGLADLSVDLDFVDFDE